MMLRSFSELVAEWRKAAMVQEERYSLEVPANELEALVKEWDAFLEESRGSYQKWEIRMAIFGTITVVGAEQQLNNERWLVKKLDCGCELWGGQGPFNIVPCLKHIKQK